MARFFAECPVCGLKLGRKGGFCPRCLEQGEPATAGKLRNAAPGAGTGRGFFLPLLLAAVTALIVAVFIRAARLGISIF